MFSHISGTSSKGSCTAWKWAGKGSLLLTLLLKEICRGLDVQEVIPSSQEHPVPPATSGPCFSPLHLPRQVEAGWESPGALGRGTQGCSIAAHCSEGGEEQEAAEPCQLLGNSLANLPPVRKHFFQRSGWVFTGTGLDDQVI